MSVVVDHLSKHYGMQKALDDISFEAPKGKITGFLGPNGAGKSTTMKIANGYISATSGSISVEGIDVAENPLQVKQLTGYLPENNPLYYEMYVREYLTFIGSSYKIRSISDRIEEVIERCGLMLESKKKIGMLSKGYRQRVGLAQALIHDPEVLILDEPTSGLDPNQLVEIRKVIKEASKEKTVILSTHIMQEVELLCDKVVIINKGKIVADGAIDTLRDINNQSTSYLVVFENPIDTKLFSKEGLEVNEHANHYEISSDKDPRKVILDLVAKHELPLVSIAKNEQSLESVFQELTKES